MKRQLWSKAANIAIVVGLAFWVGVLPSADMILADDPPQGKLLFHMDGYLYTLNADGTDLQEFIRTGVEVSFARWSPDGQQIVFYGKPDGVKGIYVINADGTGMRNLTQNLGGAWPQWSPDGERILYLRLSDGNRVWQIFIMHRDGSNHMRIGDVVVTDPYISWSPDGQWITFSLDDTTGETSQIYRLALDGGEITRLTDATCLNSYPQWSPDEQYIAFESCRDIDDDLYVMHSDGSNLMRLTTTPQASVSGLHWSPDSQYIAYMERNEEDDGWLLHVIRPDGSGLTQIGWDVSLYPIYAYDFAWSPTSNYIALSGFSIESGHGIYLIDTSCLSLPIDCGDVVATNLTEQYSATDIDVRWALGLDWTVTGAQQ